MSQLKTNEVMEGTFDRLAVSGATLPGPWEAACLSGFTGPTWVFVHAQTGDVVPLSSVVSAKKEEAS